MNYLCARTMSSVMRKSTALSLMLMLAVPAVSGQNSPLIDIQGDVKVINVADLGLPSSTQASRVLEVLPELMTRPGDRLIQNYDVIVDGLSAGYSNDAVLSQLTVADIESITVSQNSIASYQSNGQSGSIEISLKKAGKGLSGNGALRVSNMYGSESSGLDSRLSDIIPKIQVDYVADRFRLRGLSLYEHYNPMTLVRTTGIPQPEETVRQYTDEKAYSTMNVVWGEYAPSASDRLNMSVAVMAAGGNRDIAETSTCTEDQFSSLDRRGCSFDLTANYRHVFDDGSILRLSGHYGNGPQKMALRQMSVMYGDTVRSMSVAGKAEYGYPFHLLDERLNGMVSAGVNANVAGNGKLQTDRRAELGGIGLSELETRGRTSYIMPYVTFRAAMDDLSLSGYVNYRMYRSRITREQGRSFNLRMGSLSGMVVSAWEFVPGQKLRIMYDRSVQSPSPVQTYPFPVFDPENYAFVQGNGALRPVRTDELSGDFISQSQVGDRQIVINMGLGYMKVSDVIAASPLTIYQGLAEYDGITYDNAGSNNIAKVNSMFLLKQRGYTASVTANMFYNIGDRRNAASDHYTYCNLGMNQSVEFGDGWGTGLGLYFNSPIFMSSSSMGKLVHTQFAISKDLDGFSLEGILSCPLSGKVTDQKYSSGQTIDTVYPLVKTSVSFVARYYF